MSISDIKMYSMSVGAIGVSMLNEVEDWLKIILLLITIGYTLSKWIKLKKEK